MPYYSSVALATATGKHRYAPEERDRLDLSNQVEVEYPRSEGDVVTVPREELSEGLQRRLRVRGSTVSNLEEFADEIDALFEGKGFTWQARLEKEEEQRRKEFQRQLLHNIRDGQTNLQAGGVGLEQLVARLLECEGYNATVLSKQAFPGLSDADVKASRSDRFGEQQLLVQVKHHRGTSGSWGAKQLASIREHLPDQYGDHQLVLVTTADVSDKLEAECEEQDIACVDGEELAEWISDHADHLGPEFRRKLGISAVPELTV